MTAEIFDLTDYQRVQRCVRMFYKGEWEGLPEGAQRAYLKQKERLWRDSLAFARLRYASVREARQEVGWPYRA